MSNTAYFAKLVKMKRIEKELTQVELAKLADVSEKTIRDFETGKNPNIHVENLLSICVALDLCVTISASTPVTEERTGLLREATGPIHILDNENLRLYHQYQPKLFEILMHMKKLLIG